MKTVYGYQWSEQEREVNFGDLISEVILMGLGITYRPIDARPIGEPGLLMVGTILDLDRLGWMLKRGPIHVWGTGYAGNASVIRGMEGITFHAVRGPLTRDILWLPRETQLGDPGLVLPQFIDRHPNGRTLCIPHWESIFKANARGCEFLSPLCGRMDVCSLIGTIAGADFVLAGSLHAAIIAHAYGIPWAMWEGYTSCPHKWIDWAGYLGVGYLHSCGSLDEGKKWWDVVGCDIPRNTTGLLSSFPGDAVVDI